ncbi:MAG: Fic family protein [Gammaproteobacteria bacterium]|nr:Fic family protein [Gammaproteobacteria bacterium]
MASPSEKLAESLEALKELQDRDIVAVRSTDLSRTHSERLLKNGFLQKVMKGWYVPSDPEEQRGESTGWYALFWDFCSAYLEERFEKEWCLSPEQSLFLHAGNRTVPQQLLVRAPKGGNKPTNLPHNTSLMDVKLALPEEEYREQSDKLRIYTLPASLVFAGPGLFRQNSTDARAALAMIQDTSDVLAILLDGGHSKIAGRLAGAFRNIGRDKIADEIIKTMKSAGYDVRENDPFEEQAPFVMGTREPSPYVTRVKLMWHTMREEVIDIFPEAPKKKTNIDAYMKHVEEIYVTDAYHSLSIEGYRVSAELIERVRSGAWNPDNSGKDREQTNALAARGYHEAFEVVTPSIRKVLDGQNAGEVADDDHSTWYRELFAPSITAGILKASDLAGYRNRPVFIRKSMHAPPSREAVRDMMPLLFELLREEYSPAVRVVLGHFVFVYIHPYIDGNGRIGRFLMNVMLASGGYPWTIIPVQKRDDYMQSLEAASVHQNIKPFTEFLGNLVRDNIEGKPGPKVPAD